MEQVYGSAVRRPDLAAFSYEYMEKAPAMGFIGLRIMPLFKTPFQSHSWGITPKEVFLKIYDTLRSPKSNYNRAEYKTESAKYSCSEYGWEEAIDDSQKALYEALKPGYAFQTAVQRCLDIILRGLERKIALRLHSGDYLSANSLTNEWDDYSNATPIDDVGDAIVSFRSQCGMLPDAMTVAYSTFQDLKRCSQIMDRIKYTYPGVQIADMTPQLVAQCLGINELLVGGAVYDSAGENIATSIADIWSNEYACLVKLPSRPDDLEEPCVGHTFLWTEDSPSAPVIETYRDETIRSEIVRARMQIDVKFLQSEQEDNTAVSEIYKAVTYQIDNVTT